MYGVTVLTIVYTPQAVTGSSTETRISHGILAPVPWELAG